MLKVVIFILLVLYFTLYSETIYAIVEPRSVLNNKYGIHILFASEIEEASALVNSNGGDWGYVTIPIQATDKNLEKWQKFMDDARRLHIIPILRLATENYYFNTKVWRKPVEEDILDYANFLNSLDWPTKNRYIIVFNEVNRADEWGGKVSPAEYAEILQYAVDVFKSRSDDFFVISSGLDNASENISGQSINPYAFMEQMNNAVPGIFGRIDGIASHSYPNPGFRQPPSVTTKKSIASFRFEKNLADSLGSKNLPVFITETGWSSDFVDLNLIASYYKEAFDTVWNEIYIVAVTPFLLDAREGPFAQFSLKNRDGTKNKILLSLERIKKQKGEPILNKKPSFDSNFAVGKTMPSKDFSEFKETNDNFYSKIPQSFKIILKWFAGI